VRGRGIKFGNIEMQVIIWVDKLFREKSMNEFNQNQSPRKPVSFGSCLWCLIGMGIGIAFILTEHLVGIIAGLVMVLANLFILIWLMCCMGSGSPKQNIIELISAVSSVPSKFISFVVHFFKSFWSNSQKD
jgi:protein-S-isoprenylcysteine O-methyltransferase Ste14